MENDDTLADNPFAKFKLGQFLKNGKSIWGNITK